MKMCGDPLSQEFKNKLLRTLAELEALAAGAYGFIYENAPDYERVQVLSKLILERAKKLDESLWNDQGEQALWDAGEPFEGGSCELGSCDDDDDANAVPPKLVKKGRALKAIEEA